MPVPFPNIILIKHSSFVAWIASLAHSDSTRTSGRKYSNEKREWKCHCGLEKAYCLLMVFLRKQGKPQWPIGWAWRKKRRKTETWSLILAFVFHSNFSSSLFSLLFPLPLSSLFGPLSPLFFSHFLPKLVFIVLDLFFLFHVNNDSFVSWLLLRLMAQRMKRCVY